MRRPDAYSEGQAKDTGAVLRRLIPYLLPYKGRLALIVVLLLLSVLTNLLGPYLIGVAVDEFITADGSRQVAWLRWLVSPEASRAQGLAVVMFLLLANYALAWLLNVAQFRLLVRMAQRILLEMRSQILQQVQRLSLSFFDQHEAGDLMSRLINDTQVINQMFGVGLLRLLGMILIMIGIVASMVALNWRLALASFTVLPLIVVITALFSRRARRAFRETRQTIGQVSAELQENIAGVREVQAFAREAQTLSEFQAVNERNRLANVQAETLISFFMPLLDVLSTAATAIVIGFGGYLILAFTPPLATIGILVSFLNYVRRFYDPIRELANLYGQLQAALAGAERIFELLDEEPDITDAPDAIELPPVQGLIEYDHVSFRYIEDEPVLDDVSFRVEPGQTVAIVGPTGAGKTTIINLLARFYDVDSGAIRIDGHDVRHVTLDSLRRQIGVVPQDTFLFSTTVMENIRYGRLEASDEEVIAAAKVANAHQFIERLPEGYQTEIGERGSRLSQGNRQLLAIARAILKDPRILILDEATSSVDTRTELLIQRAIERLMSQRTNLVIAHRLSTIRNADQILVIQQGKIVERGTHEELLARGGVYHELYMSQFRGQEELVSAQADLGEKPACADHTPHGRKA
ncbi:MAG: ABC transporter ATP-binding protein [Chloroflexi bacterium]|nr:ABC transporter ATP-binding protein [Chloroflexota bacterium]